MIRQVVQDLRRGQAVIPKLQLQIAHSIGHGVEPPWSDSANQRAQVRSVSHARAKNQLKQYTSSPWARLLPAATPGVGATRRGRSEQVNPARSLDSPGSIP